MSKRIERIKYHKEIVLWSTLFGIIYALISFGNHYNFRTYTYDLGAYTNALYDYARFQWNDSSSFLLESQNLLADHFDLYLPLFSPLSFLFGTYTLLVVQILALLIGGYFIYLYFRSRQASTFLSITATVYFYAFYGVYGALATDYHSNVVAAALLPVFFYFIQLKRLKAATLMLIILLIGKENMGLWLAFVCFGLSFTYWKESMVRNYLWAASGFCLLYFYAVLQWIMPSFANEEYTYGLRYSYLGTNLSEAVSYIFNHPIDVLKTFFVSHLDDPFAQEVKASLHWILLSSGLPFLLKKPQYLLMLLPIYFQKLFHDNFLVWSISYQYNIEFAPIFAIGIFSVIQQIKAHKPQKIFCVLAIIMASGSTIYMMDSGTVFLKRSQLRFYKADHYQRNYDVKKVHEAFKLIPNDAIVAAQPPFLPHLALRDNIYNFPFIQDADYLVFSYLEEEMPFFKSKEAYVQFSDSLKQSPEWEVLLDDEVTILKRSTPFP